jgi:PAS domain S-box-containing protein
MKKKELLVVDDDEIVCNIVSVVLDDTYDIRVAHDGNSAVQMIQQHPPHIVLCDIVMDKGDGYSVIEFLRSRNEFCEIPIVMMTSLTNKDLQRRGMYLGADDVIQKPFSEQELALSLAARVKRHELEQKLRNSMDELRSVFDSFPDMFFRITKEGDIVERYANSNVLEKLQTVNYNDRNIFSFIPYQIRGSMQYAIDQVLSGGQMHSIEFHVSLDGSLQYYEARFMSFRLKDEVLCVIREITERKRQDVALALSEKKFSTVFFSSPSMMCIYDWEHELCIDVNDAFCAATGYLPAELIGMPLATSNIFPYQLFEDIRNNKQDVERTLVTSEVEYVTKNEEVRYGVLQYETITIRDMLCIIFFIRDITQERENEKVLLERHDIFKQMTDAIDDIVWIHDTEGRVIYYKPSSKYSLLPQESLGKKPSELNVKDIFSKNIQQVVSANKSVISVETVSVDNEDITFALRWNPICGNGNKVIAVSVFAKISSLSEQQEPEATRPNDLFHKIFIKLRMFRHGESLLMIINRLLLFSRNTDHFISLSSLDGEPTADHNVARRISIAINEYLMRVFPEVNTLAMYAQLLSERSAKELNENSFNKLTENMLNLNKFNYDYMKMIASVPGKRKRTADALNYDSIMVFNNNLKELKSAILKLNKSIRKTYCSDVNQTVRDVLDSIRSNTVEYGIQFVPKNQILLGIIRRSELYEVILIILKNAIEAIQSQSGSNREPSISIETSGSGEFTQIRISDNGPGISEQMKNEIFVLGKSSKIAGGGFGLYYANNIVKEYGGEITFTNNTSAGTAFTINLLIP